MASYKDYGYHTAKSLVILLATCNAAAAFFT